MQDTAYVRKLVLAVRGKWIASLLTFRHGLDEGKDNAARINCFASITKVERGWEVCFKRFCLDFLESSKHRIN